MPSDWSREEVEAIVADYLAMLKDELSGLKYSKAEHRRLLQPLLNKRSEQSIEFKHANISAVLIGLGFPYISGYKPRKNYQGLLHEVVQDRLVDNKTLTNLAASDVEKPVIMPTMDDILRSLTNPPKSGLLGSRVAEPLHPYLRSPINYLEREAHNRHLGLAGEEFVVDFERARLINLGQEKLAAKIEHVSKSRGDGEGFDVLSFEGSGAERLVEVKTTRYGRDTPFFVSRNELEVSQLRHEHYYLYRLFEFRQAPRLFTLHGALSKTCHLDPAVYFASVSS
jgi:hypothetical protein